MRGQFTTGRKCFHHVASFPDATYCPMSYTKRQRTGRRNWAEKAPRVVHRARGSRQIPCKGYLSLAPARQPFGPCSAKDAYTPST